MVYKAVFADSRLAIYLTKDSQIDEYLEKGAEIYRGEDEESMELIATPEDGLLVEHPTFPVPVTFSFK